MLKVDGLSKYFGPLQAVKQVSFHIPKGTVVGLVGPNGAGKTTLLNCITTFLNAEEGDVHINGHNLYKEPAEAKRHLAFVAELPNPFGYLRVWEPRAEPARWVEMNRLSNITLESHRDSWIEDDHLVIVQDEGFKVFDLTNITSPEMVHNTTFENETDYVSHTDTGHLVFRDFGGKKRDYLRFYNISDLSQPRLSFSLGFKNQTHLYGSISEDLLIIKEYTGKEHYSSSYRRLIFNVSDPSQPYLSHKLKLENTTSYLGILDDRYLIIRDYATELEDIIRIFELQDQGQISEVANYSLNFTRLYTYLVGDNLFLRGSVGLSILNLANPAVPREVFRNDILQVSKLYFQGQNAYHYDSGSLHLLNLSQLAPGVNFKYVESDEITYYPKIRQLISPDLNEIYQLNEDDEPILLVSGIRQRWYTEDIIYENEKLFHATYSGLKVVNISNPGTPLEVGQFRVDELERSNEIDDIIGLNHSMMVRSDNEIIFLNYTETDNIVPWVTLDEVTPCPVEEGDQVTLKVNATDVDGSIDVVRWYVNREFIWTDSVLVHNTTDLEGNTKPHRVQRFYVEVRDNEGAWSGELEYLVVIERRSKEPVFMKGDVMLWVICISVLIAVGMPLIVGAWANWTIPDYVAEHYRKHKNSR